MANLTLGQIQELRNLLQVAQTTDTDATWEDYRGELEYAAPDLMDMAEQYLALVQAVIQVTECYYFGIVEKLPRPERVSEGTAAPAVWNPGLNLEAGVPAPAPGRV